MATPVARRKPRPITEAEAVRRASEPMNWTRALLTGFGGSALMMAFIDIFNMLGMFDFSFERYLGGLLLQQPWGAHVWTVGLLANWVVGALWGLLYGYFFEYIFGRATPRLGVLLGIPHAFIAALGLFPFFGMFHNFVHSGVYPNFGVFGSGITPGGPVLLFIAHLLFGAVMGTFYGPVGVERVRARVFEPGEENAA